MATEQSEQGEGCQQRGLDLGDLKEGGAGAALHKGVRDGATGEIAGFFVSRRGQGNEGEMRAAQ